MPAVVTDQFRIANAGNFVDSVLDSNNSYYVFLGLPNPAVAGFGRTTSWPSDPIDNQQYLTHYRDTSLFGKRLNSSNIRRVVKKHNWVSNIFQIVARRMIWISRSRKVLILLC